jgi:DNA-binding MarR family transcriptional regulator
MGRVCWSCAASSPTACSPTAISVHGIAASIAWRAPSSARAIAERSSFAKAATHLGISRSALSETIRGLEEKLGVRLLNQTTRSVALTDVGERLLAELRPAAFEAGAGALSRT